MERAILAISWKEEKLGKLRQFQQQGLDDLPLIGWVANQNELYLPSWALEESWAYEAFSPRVEK